MSNSASDKFLTNPIDVISPDDKTFVDDESDNNKTKATTYDLVAAFVLGFNAQISALSDLSAAPNKIPIFTSGTEAGLLDFLDQDNMSSNSETGIPSQQSVKAYVDAVKNSEKSLQSVDVAVSSAEILALHTTPKTIIPAPGANKAIIFNSAVFFYDYNSIAYAGIATGDDMGVYYTNASGQFIAGCELTGFFDQTSDKYSIAPLQSPILPILRLAVNEPIVISLTGAVTSGNSPMGVRAYYRIIDLSTLVSV